MRGFQQKSPGGKDKPGIVLGKGVTLSKVGAVNNEGRKSQISGSTANMAGMVSKPGAEDVAPSAVTNILPPN